MTLLDDQSSVVIVGAGLAGWRLAEALRSEAFTGTITIVGEEAHFPYDRPPLSKQVLSGKWDVALTTLVPDQSLVAQSIDWRLGARAVALDACEREVTLDDGVVLRASHVALATGSRARTMSYSAAEALHLIRSQDDLERLLADLETTESKRPWVVIGAGFLGAEVATAFKIRGVASVVLEVAHAPLEGVVGAQAASWLRMLPEDFGVTLRTDEKVRDVEWRGKVLTVSLDSGEDVEAAGVVVCVGSQLDLTWLEGSGLELDGGVVVDEHLQASANVAALGDVARFAWPGPLGVEMLRIEHWEVAVFHAAQLARYWTQGVGPERVMVPYFWSDQYGKKIQMLGHPRPDDEVTLVHGDVTSKQWLALYARDEIVTGLLALSSPRPLMLAKVVLDEVTSRDHALERAPWRV